MRKKRRHSTYSGLWSSPSSNTTVGLSNSIVWSAKHPSVSCLYNQPKSVNVYPDLPQVKKTQNYPLSTFDFQDLASPLAHLWTKNFGSHFLLRLDRFGLCGLDWTKHFFLIYIVTRTHCYVVHSAQLNDFLFTHLFSPPSSSSDFQQWYLFSSHGRSWTMDDGV